MEGWEEVFEGTGEEEEPSCGFAEAVEEAAGNVGHCGLGGFGD